MEIPFIRIDLSKDCTDFAPAFYRRGMPVLDEFCETGELLGEWLGRFAAEPVWEGESVGFFVRNDDGSRPVDMSCVPATEVELRGELREEFELLKQRVRESEPESDARKAIHRFVCRGLLDWEPGSGAQRCDCQFFKYKDADGVPRLVWCFGYVPNPEREDVPAVICGNPECRYLVFSDEETRYECPQCGKALPRPPRFRHAGKVLVSLLLLLLLGAGAVYAYTRPSAELNGHVVRADQRPIAEAQVRVHGSLFATRCDEHGVFRLKRLPEGDVTVDVSAPGYRAESIRAKLVAHQANKIDVSLTGIAQVSGKVAYRIGCREFPIAGARVAAVDLGTRPVETNDRGEFTLTGLPPGSLQLDVQADGFCSRAVEGDATLKPISTISVVLTGNCEVAGRVVLAADESVPVADASVTVEGIPQATAVTDKNGRFVLGGLPPVPLPVVASATGFCRNSISAAPGDTLVLVPLIGDALLTGYVIRGDKYLPVPDAVVRLAGTPFETQTDRRGLFRLEGVRSGEVQVEASSPGMSASVIRDLPANRETSIQLVLLGGATAHGRVVCANENWPLAGAAVRVADTFLESSTDEQGFFALRGVPASEVTLHVSAEDRIPREIVARLTAGKQRLADIALRPTVTVGGTVVSAMENRPVEGAEVVIGSGPLRTSTDENGRFQFSGLTQIPVTVWASADRYGRNSATAADDTDSLCIRLAGDGCLTGTIIRGDTQQPAGGAEVLVSGTPLRARTDDAGCFQIDGMCSGPAEITTSLPGMSAQLTTEVLANQDTTVRLILVGHATAQGQIVCSGSQEPIADATIAIAETTLQTSTDGEGKFSLAGIPSSEVTFHVSAPNYLPRDLARTLVDGEQELEEIILSPAATVQGFVARALDGRPFVGAEVAVAGTQLTARTDDGGEFEISGIPYGPVTFRIAATGYRPLEIDQQLSSSVHKLEPVSLVGDTKVGGVTIDADSDKRAVRKARIVARFAGHEKEVTSENNGGFELGDVPSGTIELTATAAGYRDASVRQTLTGGNAWMKVPMTRLHTVTGQVLAAGSRQTPIANASVRVSVDGFARPATSDQYGRFSVSVPAGEAVVTATAEGYCDATVRRRVSADDPRLDIPLVPGTTVRGIVLNGINNEPVSYCHVTVGSSGVERTAYTNARGQFSIDGVPAGNATVDFAASGFEPITLTHQAGSNTELRAILSPELPEGEVRVILTWGERPRDLDGHLFGPLPYRSGRFHVSFEDRTADGVQLDVDAKKGLGPETITLKVIPGKYQYYVADSANIDTWESQPLARSGAEVRVYFKGSGAKRPYTLPDNVRGPVWHAFDIVVDERGKITIAPVHEWLQDLPTE